MNIKRFPTLFPELNDVLDELVTAVSHTLQHNFIAAYLQGSFGMGAGDEHSDVDFLIVIDQPLFADEVVALQAIHGHIYDLAPPWSTHLEGSYFP
ncbi:MAG: nucleotidyltransferase domain-containing protein, partial [Chloroflexi bacterium]|nr:nucleotidyltransferase domain-containing protein [Chloroflexota bacterium]